MAYLSMLQGTNRLYSDSSNIIKPPDFKKGYALYCFNLSPDISNDTNFNILETGALSVEIKLYTSNANIVTMIAFREFDAIILITVSKSVIYDV